jgi:uncharacterized membrane protein YqjE
MGIDTLIQGKLFDAMIEVFTGTGISSDIFYLTLLVGGLALMFIKNKSLGMLTVMLLIVAVPITSIILGEAHKYLYAMMFFGAVSLIYSVFKSKGY